MELENIYTDYRFHEFGNCCSCLSCWWHELWILLLTVKSIHNRCALTFTVYVDVTCAKLQAYKSHTGFPSTMLKNILEITAYTVCVCKCLGSTFGDTSVKIFNSH